MYSLELTKDIAVIETLIAQFIVVYGPDHPNLSSINIKLSKLKEIIPTLWDPDTYLGSMFHARPMSFLMTNVITTVGYAQQIFDEILSEITQKHIGEQFRKLKTLKDDLKQNQDALIFQYKNPPFLVAYENSRKEFKAQAEFCFLTIHLAKVIEKYKLYGYIPVMLQDQNDNNNIFPFKINPENILLESNISLIEHTGSKTAIGLIKDEISFITKGYDIDQLSQMNNWIDKFLALKNNADNKKPTSTDVKEFAENLSSLENIDLSQEEKASAELPEASLVANILRGELALEKDPFDLAVTKFSSINTINFNISGKYAKQYEAHVRNRWKLFPKYIREFSQSAESLSGQSYKSFENLKNINDNNNESDSSEAVLLDIKRLKKLGVDSEVIYTTIANFNNSGLAYECYLELAKMIEKTHGILLEGREVTFQIKPRQANLLVRIYSNITDIYFDNNISGRRRNLADSSLMNKQIKREPSIVLTFDFLVERKEGYTSIEFSQGSGYVTQYAPAFVHNLVLDGLYDPTLNPECKFYEIVEFLGALYLFLLEKLQNKLITEDLIIKFINHYCAKIQQYFRDGFLVDLDEVVNRDLYAVGSKLFRLFKEADVNEFKLDKIILYINQSLNTEKFKDSPETWDSNDIKHFRELIFSIKHLYNSYFDINYQDVEDALELLVKPVKESSSTAIQFLRSACGYVNLFLTTLRNLKNIKSLNLSGNKIFTQQDFENILKIFPDLQILDFSNTMVTSIKYRAQCKIFQINLSQCKRLETVDIYAPELALNLEGCDGVDLNQIAINADKFTILKLPSHYRKTLETALSNLSQAYEINNQVEIFLKDFSIFTSRYNLFCDQKYTAGTQFLRKELIAEWIKFIEPVLQMVRPISFIVDYYRIFMPEIAFAMQLVLSLDESLFLQLCQNGIISNDWLTIALSIVVESNNNKDLITFLINNGADPFKRITLGSEVKPIKNITMGNISAFERAVLKLDMSVVKLFLTPQRYNSSDFGQYVKENIHIEIMLYSALGYALEKQNYPIINYLFFIIRTNILANAPLQHQLLQHAAFRDKYIFVSLMIDHQFDWQKLLENLPREHEFIDMKLNVPDMVLSIFLHSLEFVRKKLGILFDVDFQAKQIKNLNFKPEDSNFNFSNIQVMDDYNVQNMLASNLLLVTFQKLIQQGQVPYMVLLYKKCVESLSLQQNDYKDLFLLAAKLNCWQLTYEILFNNPDKISLDIFNNALLIVSHHTDLSTYLMLSKFKSVFITSETILLQSQFNDVCQAIRVGNAHLTALLLKVYPQFTLKDKKGENLLNFAKSEGARDEIIQLIEWNYKQFDQGILASSKESVSQKSFSGNDPNNINSTWAPTPLPTATTLEDAIRDPSALQDKIFTKNDITTLMK